MTRQEIQQRSEEKVKAIQTLAKQLQIIVSAEQIINKQGFIKMVVYYTDIEKYDMREEPITIPPDEIKPIEGEATESAASEGETSESKTPEVS